MEQYLFHFLFRTFDTVVRTILNFSTFRFSIFERKAALLELKSTRPSSRCKARRWRENSQTNTRFPPVGKSGGGEAGQRKFPWRRLRHLGGRLSAGSNRKAESAARKRRGCSFPRQRLCKASSGGCAQRAAASLRGP